MKNKGKVEPQFILIMGAVCSGKSHFIDQNFKIGYVHIDAGQIFIALSKGKYYDFPSILEEEMNKIGLEIANKALREKLNIVMEIIGDNEEEISLLISSLKAIGYQVVGQFIDCDIEIALERNKNRSDDNISAFYTQTFHFKWISEAINKILSGV